MSDSQLSALLFVQLMCILGVCRGLGWLFARLRQPLVVAEMVAGFLLGPEREDPEVEPQLNAERVRLA